MSSEHIPQLTFIQGVMGYTLMNLRHMPAYDDTP